MDAVWTNATLNEPSLHENNGWEKRSGRNGGSQKINPSLWQPIQPFGDFPELSSSREHPGTTQNKHYILVVY